jgi:hypothetical protein
VRKPRPQELGHAEACPRTAAITASTEKAPALYTEGAFAPMESSDFSRPVAELAATGED